MNLGEIMLGWALGIFSSPIISLIKDRNDGEKLQFGLISELSDIRVRALLGIYKIAIVANLFDDEFFNWFKTHLIASQNTEIGKTLNLREIADVLLKPNISAASIVANTPISLESLTIPLLYLPYLNSKISDLHLLSGGQQMRLSALLRHASTYNYAATQIDKWNTMSFQIADVANHAKCVLNEQVQTRAMFNSSKNIIDEITCYFNEPGRL
jgi:hypothetical protein